MNAPTSLAGGVQAANAPAAAPARPPHVVVFGVFGIPNWGNDASFEVLISALRRAIPKVRLTCVVRDPDYIARRYNVTTRPIYAPARFETRSSDWRTRAPKPLRRVLNESARRAETADLLADADYLVIPGTGILDDFGTPALDVPYRLWTACLAARRHHAPVDFVSVGVGGFNDRLSRAFVGAAVRLAAYRSYRDQQSMDRAHKLLGVKTDHDELAPDLVFALPRQAGWDNARTEVETIGVGVQNYRNRRGLPGPAHEDRYPRYMSTLAEFCVSLLDRGLSLRLLTGEANDRGAADDLRARLISARPALADAVVFEEAADLHGVCAQIAKCDAVVATRFHNIVASLLVGRPTLSLEYAPKNTMLMRDFGLGDYCQSIERGIELDLLHQQFAAVIAAPAQLRAQIVAHTEELHALACAHLDAVAARVRAAAKPRQAVRA